MKINGTYNYNDAHEKINEAAAYLDKEKSIEYKLSITITACDSEYKELENDAELTISEAAKILNHYDGGTLRAAIRKGYFNPNEYRLVGKTYLILASAIERYKDKYKGKTGFASKKTMRRCNDERVEV
jgi:hypothetical protein